MSELTLEAVENQIWRKLDRAAVDAKSQWQRLLFSTLDGSGFPTSRTVVLRAVDQDAAALIIHTDRRSRKVAELTENPKCSMTFYDRKSEEQLRISAVSEFADEKTCRMWWDQIGEQGRRMYRVEGGPGESIPQWYHYEHSGEGADNFAVIVLKIQRMDWVKLDREGHKRARFEIEPASAVWLVP
jgi:hypothetical protein